MSRKFWGRKEINFVGAITKELIQAVIGQEVVYFAVSLEHTTTHDLYNEAIAKATSAPVGCNALVYFQNTNDRVTVFPPDSQFTLDVYFHTQELVDRSLDPKMGDFVQFGTLVYEVYSVSQPQLMFGQIEQKVMTKCVCGPARKGQFDPTKRPSPVAREDLQAPLYSAEPPARKSKP